MPRPKPTRQTRARHWKSRSQKVEAKRLRRKARRAILSNEEKQLRLLANAKLMVEGIQQMRTFLQRANELTYKQSQED